MNKKQIIEKIKKVKQSKSTIGELHFLLKEERVLRGNVDEETQKSLSEAFIQDLFDFFSNEEVQIMNLSEIDDRSNVIYLYDYEGQIKEFEVIKSIIRNDAYENYSFKHDNIKNLKAYIMTYVNEDCKLTIIQQHYPFYLLKKDTNILLNFSGSNQINKLDGDIFRLSCSFDFLIIDDELYIKDINKLETKYAFHEIIKSNALSSIEQIKKLNLVEDISELKVLVENITYARKLIRASKKSPVLNEVPKQEILSFICSYSNGYLLDKIKLNKNKDSLVLKTQEAKRIFIKLLNDDFLLSELTKHKYDSLAKDEVNG